MHIEAKAAPNFGRFSDLLLRTASEAASYDRILKEYETCIVAPTLGSILPNWLLIIPKVPVVNFLDFSQFSGVNPVVLVRALLRDLRIDSRRVFWFEHGPLSSGSLVGCGVDQAHLHVLIDAPFGFSAFRKLATLKSGLKWTGSPADELFYRIPNDQSYLTFGSEEYSYFASEVDVVGSQFFRRVIAELAGYPDAWNYREHQWLTNVEKTVSSFNVWAAVE